jgi:DNA primase
MTGAQRTTTSSGVDGKMLVLQAADIVAEISKTVALQKRGRSFVGLCPFHSEKSPSFHVHPDRGYFYCFGCRENGNVIDFVMKRDRLEFGPALRALAEQLNIELPRLGGEGGGLRRALQDACSAAAAYFEQNLWDKDRGAAGRAYLKSRGFNKETVKSFRIGLAPNAWDGLLSSPLMKKFDRELLVQAGLLKVRDNDGRGGGGGHYDVFRDRLMFPIRDEAGRVIAFGGRVMPGNDSPAKYLNSPETPLFSKSRVAYGLDLGRNRVVETKTVAVVEGYTDVVMAHQFGAANVISVLGTALTEQHINLLRRFADRIVLLFDGDAAGGLAVDRALQLFLTQPIEIGIATLPDGIDPDEYLLKNGLEAFDALLAGAENPLSFQWRQVKQEFAQNGDDVTGQSRAVEAYLTRLSNARGSIAVDELRWGAALAQVSARTDIPIKDLQARFASRRRPSAKPPAADAHAAPRLNSDSPPGPPARPSARSRAERELLAGLLLEPSAWPAVQQIVDDSDFYSNDLRPFAAWYWDYQRHEGQPTVAEVLAAVGQEELKTLAIELAQAADAMPDVRQAMAEAVAYFQRDKERTRQAKLLGQLKRSKSDGLDEAAEIDALTQIMQAGRARSGGQAS